jgi:polyisoprenoid-binding protein YceI
MVWPEAQGEIILHKQSLKFAATTAAAVVLLNGLSMANSVSVSSAQSATQSATQSALYTSCSADKLTAPLTLNAAGSATAAATSAAPAAAATAQASNDDVVFLSIVGSDSEACYLTSESFLKGNMMNLPEGFNGAVGITHTISGDIALDRTNVTNSQIGDITINVSEFKSDNNQRDGFIRKNFLESNKYPYATLTGVTAIGLPSGAYTDGTSLNFQIKGTLTVHNTPRDTTFDATGTWANGTLVIHAVTELNMSDFGNKVPDIGGLLKVDDALRLEVNLVARESQGTATATPAA